MKLIINADDFGMSQNTNSAIMDAFSKGWITNTTIMTNMPGFEEAVKLAREHDLMSKVGLHLNFFEGDPLSQELRKDPIFSEGGAMIKGLIRSKLSPLRSFFLPKATVLALQKEAEAQIQAYLEAGFTQMHIDSHCHSHTICSVYRAILPVIKKYGFRTVRKSLNFYGIERSPLTRLYKNLFNRSIEKHFLSTDYFSSAQEYIAGDQNLLREEHVCELMVHPVYYEGQLVNKGGSDFDEVTKYAKEFHLITFSQLTKG